MWFLMQLQGLDLDFFLENVKLAGLLAENGSLKLKSQYLKKHICPSTFPWKCYKPENGKDDDLQEANKS